MRIEDANIVIVLCREGDEILSLGKIAGTVSRGNPVEIPGRVFILDRDLHQWRLNNPDAETLMTHHERI